MSLNDVYWGDRGHCPKCGKWVGNIVGRINDEVGLIKVAGVCTTHGEVDISHQDWIFDDFWGEDREE